MLAAALLVLLLCIFVPLLVWWLKRRKKQKAAALARQRRRKLKRMIRLGLLPPDATDPDMVWPPKRSKEGSSRSESESDSTDSLDSGSQGDGSKTSSETSSGGEAREGEGSAEAAARRLKKQKRKAKRRRRREREARAAAEGCVEDSKEDGAKKKKKKKRKKKKGRGKHSARVHDVNAVGATDASGSSFDSSDSDSDNSSSSESSSKRSVMISSLAPTTDSDEYMARTAPAVHGRGKRGGRRRVRAAAATGKYEADADTALSDEDSGWSSREPQSTAAKRTGRGGEVVATDDEGGDFTVLVPAPSRIVQQRQQLAQNGADWFDPADDF